MQARMVHTIDRNLVLDNLYCNWGYEDREAHPINCVDWTQASAYCAWVGGRLPTESEWEYAARDGGKDQIYPWGDASATCEYAVMDDGGDGCGEGRTWPVCSKPKGNTSHGLCDMSGNVWEWVQDWYHSSYTGAPTDGSAWEDPVGSNRVIRGGSFYGAAYLRASGRSYASPSAQGGSHGFRCVR